MSKNRIKIFFFIDSFRIGGMHRQILYLVKHLNRSKFEPVMCTSSPLGGLRNEFEKTGCKLFDLGWKRKLNPRTVLRLIKILKSQNPEIVFISEAQNLFYYRIAKIFWRKKVIQIGSFRALSFWKGHLKKHYKPLDNFFARWLAITSNNIVVNSLAMKNHYSEILSSTFHEKMQVIYNGSDFLFTVSKTPSEIKKDLGLSFDEIIIIMVARLDPWKDFVTFLKAVEIVIKTESRAKFIIAGDGELKSTIEQMIVEMELTKHVLLIGEKKDIFNYINASDISVLSTHGEGFSNSLLESMALCKPVIATNIGGNPEVIGTNNETGLLVTPNSPQALSEAILCFVKSDEFRENSGIAAKEKIYNLCNLEKYISSYEDLFLRSLENISPSNEFLK